MFLSFDDRLSDSPFVERVWRSQSHGAGAFLSVAASHFEMAVTRHQGRIFLTVRGPETKATQADCPADGEWLGIRFKLGTFMPAFAPGDLKDRHDVTLPDATSRSFWLNGSAWTQRHFLRATGVTRSTVRQIERARYATGLLRQVVSILDTVYQAGYFDQAHLTRSLKTLIGQTPVQIQQGKQQ